MLIANHIRHLNSIQVRKRWVKQRLDPMIQESPVLDNIFNIRKSRDAANSDVMKDFPAYVGITLTVCIRLLVWALLG